MNTFLGQSHHNYLSGQKLTDVPKSCLPLGKPFLPRTSNTSTWAIGKKQAINLAESKLKAPPSESIRIGHSLKRYMKIPFTPIIFKNYCVCIAFLKSEQPHFPQLMHRFTHHQVLNFRTGTITGQSVKQYAERVHYITLYNVLNTCISLILKTL